jgi:prefoldin subunit 5
MSIEYGEDEIPFVDLGKGYKIRLEYEDLTDEKYLAKARDELRETPEIVENALAELRKLIKGEQFVG